MHVRINEAWHGKVHKQFYKLSGAQYATELHVELHLICRIVCALCHAMPHYTGHASYLFAHRAMLMWWLFTMLFASFRCCVFGLFPVTSCLWGSVRLRPFVSFMDSFFFLAGSQARWPYPRNHFYICLLVARSFAMPMLRYIPLAYHASHIVEPSL